MGRKSGSESAVALLVAFLERRQWSQAALAERLGVSVATVRVRLRELSEAGVPLEREDDHPHVWWSVPKGWGPGGVVLTADDVVLARRLLARLPATTVRNRLLAKLLLADRPALAPPEAVVVPSSVDPQEELYLPIVEDAARVQAVLSLSYFSAGRGAVESREVSPCRVIIGPPARFVARCHRSDSLKWFRVDRVMRARLVARDEARYRAVAVGEVDAFVAESVGGFHGGVDVIDVSFVVRAPESRWVAGNLPAPLAAEACGDGVRVTGRTSALVAVARFCVGLGAAVRVESAELGAVVRGLAEGVLAQA